MNSTVFTARVNVEFSHFDVVDISHSLNDDMNLPTACQKVTPYPTIPVKLF